MNSLLKNVLLIDDDRPTNVFHRIILQDINIANKIDAVQTVEEALEILRNDNNNQVDPDIIFLDLNMPGLNGWDFINQYRQIKANRIMASKIFILTTSINPDDKIKAQQLEIVAGFRSKPLTKDMIWEIVDNHFLN